MTISRRNLLKKTLVGTAVAALPALPLGAIKFLSPAEAKAAVSESKTRYAFLVDTNKCVGCGFCVKACKKENDVPYDSPVTRTWVERYLITKDGKSHIDSPKGARDGFTSQLQENQHETVDPKEIDKAFFVPKLCNQCESPACVQVCPVGATYQTNDGVVLIDRTWCIGCGYCIMACPYGVRYFHPKYKVADKCTFCYHRLAKGLKTACVDACSFGARQVCDLKNPEDPATKIILTERVAVLKDEYGTKPHVFYLGLDRNVR